MKKPAQDLFNKIFPSYAAKNENGQPVNIRPLIRGEAYKKDFSWWQQSAASGTLRELLLESYLTRSQKASTIHIALYTAPGAIGLTIKMPNDTEVKTYRFLLDFLRDQAMAKQYYLYSSAIEERWTEQTQYFYERHFLKPNILNEDYPIDQRYGNIMLELEMEADHVKYLKIMSTYHTGYNYKSPLGFDALVRYLFSCSVSGDGE